MNKNVKTCFEVVWYVIAFLLIQVVVQLLVALAWALYSGQPFDVVSHGIMNGAYSTLLIVTMVVSGLLTILLFALRKWSPVSRVFLRSRPWGVVFWTILLTLGMLLPMEWLYENLQIVMDDTTAALFNGIMREPLGYIAVGIVAPIAEEMVFRGAVLRVLLQLAGDKRHWIAIGISALLFALVHGNVAQGVHATIAGLMLGWLYYRTNSIVPGIVMHWVNNSVAYVMYNLMPEMNDGKIIDLFRGDDMMVYMALGFSLMIFLPSLFQLASRMKRN